MKHATTHNVKPIRGATVVFCNTSPAMRKQCSTARGLGKFSQSHELGILLGLMCKYVCEVCDFRIFGGQTATGEKHAAVELVEGTILDNMAVVADMAAQLEDTSTPMAVDEYAELSGLFGDSIFIVALCYISSL